MSTDIHDKIRSELERRLAIARYAPRGQSDGVWSQPDAERTPGLIVDERGEVVTYDEGRPDAAQAAHIALHDPADAIRRYEYALKVLDRHKFNGDQPYGAGDECLCIDDWPCVEITDLAESLGIDTGGTDG
jgi:hypothetical protein